MIPSEYGSKLSLSIHQFLLSFSVILSQFALFNVASPPMNYAYTQTKQCWSRTSLFLSFRGFTLDCCLKECGKRSKCVAINYRKRYDNLCELLADTSFVSKNDDCMYVRRYEMDFSVSVRNFRFRLHLPYHIHLTLVSNII